MNRALQAFVVSCVACALPAAASSEAAPRGQLSLTAYASRPDPQGGYEYVRLFPGNVVISHLDHALVSALFVNGDYSKEYAIQDDGWLVRIDTGSGTVTPIGEAVVGVWTHASITTTPNTSLTYLLVAQSPCTSSSLYALDLITGHGTLVGNYLGCLQSMVTAPDGSHTYALDVDTGSLAVLDNGIVDLGPLGFTLDDADTLAFVPGSNELFVFGYDPNVGTNNVYTVDTATGLATLIGPIGGSVPITGYAIGAPLPDAVFADGFED